jgi:hypothetical protein
LFLIVFFLFSFISSISLFIFLFLSSFCVTLFVVPDYLDRWRRNDGLHCGVLRLPFSF